MPPCCAPDRVDHSPANQNGLPGTLIGGNHILRRPTPIMDFSSDCDKGTRPSHCPWARRGDMARPVQHKGMGAATGLGLVNWCAKLTR